MNVFLAWLCALTLFLHSATSNTSGTYPDGCTNLFVTNTLQSVQDNALSYCQSQGTGGALAIIKDASTSSFIHDRINSGSPYWIGATYNGYRWVWNDGTIIGQPGYENWTPGTPSDSSSKRCLVIEKPSDGTLAKWYNVACNNAQSLPFICQVAVSAAALCDPCTHRKQCIVTGCTYKCGSCVKSYYGEDCRYLNTTFVESNQQSIKKNNSLNLEFSCTFTGFPLPNITWIFNENEINTDDVNYDITTTINPELDEIQQTLTIYQPRCIGTTTVTCEVHQNYANIVSRALSIEPGTNYKVIKNLTASVDECNIKLVSINWTKDETIPEGLAERIKYTISVQDLNNSTIHQSSVTTEYSTIEIDHVKQNTTYILTISASATSCNEPPVILQTTIKVPFEIPQQPSNARVSYTQELGKCVIQWEFPVSPPYLQIDAFTVIAFENIVTQRNNSQIKETNNTYVLNLKNDKKSDRKFMFVISVDLNRKYTFKVFASSCAGNGLIGNIDGFCLTEEAEPLEVKYQVLKAKVISTNSIKITLPKINEERGLIKCIFVVVRKNGSNAAEKGKLISSVSDLKRLTDPTDEYVAIAIKYKGSSGSYLLGDDTVSSCSLLEGNIEKEIVAVNRDLVSNQVYRLFFVTATPTTNGRVRFSTSQTTVIINSLANEGQEQQQGDNTETTWIALISVLAILLLLSFIFIIYISVRNRKLREHITSMSNSKKTTGQQNVNELSPHYHDIDDTTAPSDTTKVQTTKFYETPIRSKSPYEYEN